MNNVNTTQRNKNENKRRNALTTNIILTSKWPILSHAIKKDNRLEGDIKEQQKLEK